jgi:hypothetical protein
MHRDRGSFLGVQMRVRNEREIALVADRGWKYGER